jgi:N-sulfoglucosamine sulfohydrolase
MAALSKYSKQLMAVLYVAFTVFLLLTNEKVLGEERGRPNFLVIIADDMACEDCGAYGHPHIKTPNIDQLAREGMRFDRAFLTCSSCSPSRTSILTGRYPHATGAAELHQPVPAEQILLTTPLRESGLFCGSRRKMASRPKCQVSIRRCP